ncbi:transposase [Mycolicibacterium doricum]|uniref:Transposase n=1 Tax=Mycolicibacterium doricum TaxID=126673 RepID=A0A7I7VP67_9MYCO|nr:transposase [Mycolicibacterium doricum]
MAKKYQKFSPEFREEVVKLVVEGQQPIAKVAREHGLSETTVGNWVRKYRESAPGTSRRCNCQNARLRELERENREMAMELAFLKKAAAYFAREQR